MNRIINDPHVPFSALKASDGFYERCELYMKVDEERALSILCRNLYAFEGNRLVLPVDLDIHVKGLYRISVV